MGRWWDRVSGTTARQSLPLACAASFQTGQGSWFELPVGLQALHSVPQAGNASDAQLSFAVPTGEGFAIASFPARPERAGNAQACAPNSGRLPGALAIALPT